MTCADTPLRHGYTLSDLDGIARTACTADRSMAMDYQFKHDVAWSAAAEALYAADEPPSRSELVCAGWQAIYREVKVAWRDRGWTESNYSTWDHGPVYRNRFWAYWCDLLVVPSPERRVVEQAAVWQILDTLGPLYRDALVALAVHGGYQAAADALGVSYGTLHNRIRKARRDALALWHEGETPHRMPGHDKRALSTPRKDTCHAGHPRTPENVRVRSRLVRSKPYTTRACIPCERERDRKRRAA